MIQVSEEMLRAWWHEVQKGNLPLELSSGHTHTYAPDGVTKLPIPGDTYPYEVVASMIRKLVPPSILAQWE